MARHPDDGSCLASGSDGTTIRPWDPARPDAVWVSPVVGAAIPALPLHPSRSPLIGGDPSRRMPLAADRRR